MKKGVLWLALLSALIPHWCFAQTEQKLNIYGYMLFHFEQYLNPGGRYAIIPDPEAPGDFVRDDKTGFNAFRITRTYLYFKYQPDDHFKTQVTIDSLQDADGLYRFSLRYAFMEYKFAPELKIRMGLQYNPWNSYIHEQVWTYYMIERGAFCYWNFFPISDFGFSMLGSTLDDHLQYHAAVFNGEGLKGIENDRFKDYMGMAVLYLGDKSGINGSAGAAYSTHRTDQSEGIDLRDEVLALGGVVNAGKIKLGGEYFWAEKGMPKASFPFVDPGKYPVGAVDALKIIEGPDAMLTSNRTIQYGGWAGYLVVTLNDMFDLIGRYDFYDPNSDPKFNHDSTDMWMTGVVYKISSSIQASLDYRQYDFQEPNLDHDHDPELVPMQILFLHWRFNF